MPTATPLRDRIEAALAHKIPGALSPKPRIIREFVPTGVHSIDELLGGGVPANAITEIVGVECSGRTSLAISFLAGLTNTGKVCAWVDASDALHPESAAAAGIDLRSLLWVRCGTAEIKTSTIANDANFSERRSTNIATVPEKYFVPRPVKKGLHGGGFGLHPRGEVKGLPKAISGLLGKEKGAPPADLQKHEKSENKKLVQAESINLLPLKKTFGARKPWSRLDQALRVTDLLLQNGGFAAIVLDMGAIAPAHALRVPLATWFRYRAVAEQKQTTVILLLQHPCAKSSAALTLRLHIGNVRKESTVFAGLDFLAEVERQRFSPNAEDIAILRKPPQTDRWARWQNRTAWTGR
jgi:recombination protein RecA